MSPPSPHSYEQLRASIAGIARPEDGGQRTMRWTVARRLGVGVSRRGNYEIFIVGPQLIAKNSLVARHLEFDAWWTSEDKTLLANRIVLPSAPHFAAFCALILVELLDRGAADPECDLQKCFREVEPIIEVALRKTSLSAETTVGLVGELLVLEQMFAAIGDAPDRARDVLAVWQGYKRAARDFAIGSVAIEVKTTRGAVSSHYIHGLGQVEPLGDPHQPEDRLFLLSLGIQETEEGGVTLPKLVDRIARLLRAVPSVAAGKTLEEQFLVQVSAYVAEGETGYDHDGMSSWGVYQNTYELSFQPRLYDLCDPDVRLIRRSDLDGTFVNPEQVQYEICLPSVINGQNPHSNWLAGLAQIVRFQLGIS